MFLVLRHYFCFLIWVRVRKKHIVSAFAGKAFQTQGNVKGNIVSGAN